MKDAIITKTIPALHRSILLFFAAASFLFLFTFIALLEGFGIDRLTLGEAKIEKLYLKWENALLIKASKIDLSGMESQEEPISPDFLKDIPRIIRWSDRWIESIDIDIIKYKDYSASLSYHDHRPGTLFLRHDSLECRGSFTLDERFFRFVLPPCSFKEANLSGKMRLDLSGQKFQTTFKLLLPDTPAIVFSGSGDAKNVFFNAAAQDALTSVAPLVRFLGVDPEVAPWISEYASGSSIRLHRMEGRFAYATPGGLLESIKASATVSDGKYTFAQGFEPIVSKKIELRFEEGKLYITPFAGTFYSLPTENSRLWIDFTRPHTTLTALIQTGHAKLNDPVLNLLHHYGIDLPLKQLSGECAVDLTLNVDLHTLETTAVGTFAPTPSELLVGNVPLRSTGGNVRLDTRHVRFENFTAEYGNGVARARVSGAFDAATDKGEVLIDAYEVSPADQLNLDGGPLRVTYTIAPQGDTLRIAPSRWNLGVEKLDIEGFTAPFDYRNTALSFRSLPFRIADSVSGNISGVFDGGRKTTDLSVKLDHFDLGGIVLTHPPFTLDIRYTEGETTFSSSSMSAWSLNKLPLLLSPFHASFDGNRLAYKEAEVVLGDLLKGKFSGEYRLDDRKGSLRLDNIHPISPKLTSLIDPGASVLLAIDATDESFRLEAPAFKSRFTTIPQGWKIAFDDISLLSAKSPLLRRYRIDSGHMNLYYTGVHSQYRFDGAVDYPYSLVLINGVPQSRYRFTGAYRDGMTSIRVNNRIIIDQTPEQIYARGSNAGIHVPELFRFLTSLDDKGAVGDNESPPIRIHTTNSYLYLTEGRKIVADTLDATLQGDTFDARLQHASGSASLRIKDGRFYVDGEGFNETFMKRLFSVGDISGGSFSFQGHGKTDRFEGVMRVENAVLRDYKVLNNVLAFVNTVPSLATFSLPNYHSEGLPLKEGYAHIAYDRGIINVDNFTLDSPEMKISGEGRADVNTRTLSGKMTLKTDLGSTLGKVPMVGYILFGDDGSIATTLNLSGSLDDPKVETAIAKEIVTAPFNILKRTVIYPFLWMIPDEKKK